MSGELRRTYTSNLTLYAAIYDATAKVWRPATNAFEAFGALGRTMADYGLALTESGGSGQYAGDFDTDIEAGTYLIVYYEQLGGTPDNDDPPVGYDYGQWTGARWLTTLDLVNGPGNYLVTVTVRTTDGVAVEGVQVWANDEDDSSVSIVPVRTTDSDGEVTFYLDLDTDYYIFCEHSAYTFEDATITPVSGTLAFALDIAELVASGTEKKTCAQMIDRVLDLVGRKHTTSRLNLAEIVLDALNEAQRKIAHRIPQALDLTVSDITTFDATTGQYEYDLSTLSPGLRHLQRVWVIDGLSSQEVTFRPRDWFDRNFPDVSVVGAGFPSYYTRRGHKLLFSCPFSSTYHGKALRLDYEKEPARFTATTSAQTCELEDAEDGLILWGQVKALRAIGRADPALLTAAIAREREWDAWLTEYEARQDRETEYNPDNHPGSILYDEW